MRDDYVVSSTLTSGGIIVIIVVVVVVDGGDGFFNDDAFDCCGRCCFGVDSCCCCWEGEALGPGILGSWRRRLEGVDDDEAASLSPEFGRDDAGEAALAPCCGCAGYLRAPAADPSFSAPPPPPPLPPPPPPPPPLPPFLSQSGSLPRYCGGDSDLDPAALAGPRRPRPLGDLVRLRGCRGIRCG